MGSTQIEEKVVILPYTLAVLVVGWLGLGHVTKIKTPVPLTQTVSTTTVYHVITLQGMQTQTLTCQTVEMEGHGKN